MTKTNKNGVFVISLDFELLWGVWDVTTKESYAENILGVQKVIPRLIEVFGLYDFKVTFATVGFLFAENKETLLLNLPPIKPTYSKASYNVYENEMAVIGDDEINDPYHFGYSLFQIIKNSRHEVGTHTFCHYYCLEDGQTIEEFDADIKAAVKIAKANNVNLTSMVFPRNQVNAEYLSVLKDNGILAYRGNPTSWIYKPRKFAAEIPFIRLCRLLDTYIPISGYNTHSIEKKAGLPINIPASRFLKPYNKNFVWFEKFKLQRIKNEMTKAAQRGEFFHLWWHPHNFGINLDQNISNLEELLKHFKYLQETLGFTNLTMSEAAAMV